METERTRRIVELVNQPGSIRKLRMTLADVSNS